MKQNNMFGMSLDERMIATNGRSTGFDYMRIVLALSVIFIHSFPTSYGFVPYMAAQMNFPVPIWPFAELVVPMFFSLSGFLVAGSLYRTTTIWSFLGLRAMRLLPALGVEVFLSALVLGPLLTTVPLSAYFTSPVFFGYLLNVFGYIHYELPGLFAHNPVPNIVNAQLWTYPWELYCYLTLTVLALFGIVKRRAVFLGIVAAGTLAVFVQQMIALRWQTAVHAIPPGSILSLSFLAAVVLYNYREHIPWDGRLAAACAVAMLVLCLIPGGDYFIGFPASYTTVYIGLLNPPKIALLRGADYSYGLYLYGFAIQQAIAHLGAWTHYWYVNFLIAVIVTSGFAACSWTFVEWPVLRLKRFFVSRSAQNRSPAVESHLPAVGPIACLVLGLASLAFIARSIIFACRNYLVTLYWDQWALIDDFIHNEAATKSWTYLFKPHNEHVIATSKILFALDWVLFHFTNLPLVLSTMFFSFVVAWLLTILLFREQQRSKFFWTIWLIFSASGFSFAELENLLWGFQPQFNLVLIGALASIIIALKVPVTEGSKGFAWLAALQVAMGFCVFSMANGIAIPASVLFLLILFRASLLKCLVTAGFGAFYVATFFVMAHGGKTLGPALSPSGLFDMARFFLVMIGGAPFDADLNLSAMLGAAISAIFAVLFVRYLAVPWFRGRKVDAGLAGLFALAAFLFASVAATAWGRFFMGINFALASRYATPMLVLWMILFAVPIRLCLTSQIFPSKARFRRDILWLAIVAAFGTVAVSTLRTTDKTSWMTAISQSDRQAGYFIVSGVLNANELKALYWGVVYPDPNRVKSFVIFLREHRLNIFSPWMGLPVPSAGEIRKLSFVKSIPACKSGFIDNTTKIDSNSWEAGGWISDSSGDTPRWIVAGDDAGRILGFTAPLISRPDVERAIGARHLRGFLLPLRIPDLVRRPYYAVAIFPNGDARCRLPLPNPLP